MREPEQGCVIPSWLNDLAPVESTKSDPPVVNSARSLATNAVVSRPYRASRVLTVQYQIDSLLRPSNHGQRA
jgi:hypothetical protein